MIFHIATASDWAAARRTGSYTVSTRGRSLAEVGFVHCAHRDQLPTVFQRHYADCRERLLVLAIDNERLDVPVREEQVGSETFPHVYGPIPTSAVVDASPMGRDGRQADPTSMFLHDVLLRAGALVVVLVIGLLGLGLGAWLGDVLLQLVGLVLGLVVGGFAARLSLRATGH